MSLKQFLVVGKSFGDIPEGKSPFEMRPEVRLPKFPAEPRFTVRPPVPVQTDWLAENAHAPAVPKGEVKPEGKRSRRRQSWLEILTFGFWGKEKVQGELVQEEMMLEKVRVIRNDLTDSDLEVVVKKNQKFALRAVKAGAPAQTQAEVECGRSCPPVAETVGSRSVPAVAEANSTKCSGQECPRSTPRKKAKRFEWTELTVRLFEIGQH